MHVWLGGIIIYIQKRLKEAKNKLKRECTHVIAMKELIKEEEFIGIKLQIMWTLAIEEKEQTQTVLN